MVQEAGEWLMSQSRPVESVADEGFVQRKLLLLCQERGRPTKRLTAPAGRNRINPGLICDGRHAEVFHAPQGEA